MKILIRLVQVLTGVLLLVLSIGVFNPSIEFTTSINAPASPSVVFNQLADLTLHANWSDRVYSATSDDSQDVAGHHSIWQTSSEENSLTLLASVRDLRPPNSLEIEVEDKWLTYSLEFEITGDQTGSQITVSHVITGKNTLAKTAIPFLKSNFVEQANSDMKNFVSIIGDGKYSSNP